ncbi:haloacid dehalogenase-like hydrolase [Limibaculum sp. FT325]|uniref:HAD family hydrolase n=1 Tax=Thermohalobaculum sediminis TaxID=2939436 RepID=UPI0020BE717F|nr:HAD family hydrolase [Limibaculum sediminis]MCL5776156.1 haloacid dehalogenase-like hydrolase [Limibaculum sediminis]
MKHILALAIACAPLAATADPLPSWNETEAKSRIIAFVEGVTDTGSASYVSPADRVAVFDNDGTLWAEQPVYFQFLYAVDRLKEKAAGDPSILASDVLKAAAAGDMKAVAASGKKGLLEIVEVSHSGMSVDAFIADARAWLDSARHPQTGMSYDAMIYQPMLELLSYLRDEEFTTYIVSGGGVHFIRSFSDDAYNIPAEQVIGSIGKSGYMVTDAGPIIMKDPGIVFIDDAEGKPLAIDTRIGKRPIFAAGNSDGDFQMLEWTTTGDGPRFGMIVHHTDAEREWAYDRDSHVGRLDRGLDEAGTRGWLLVDMARDWEQVWPHAR